MFANVAVYWSHECQIIVGTPKYPNWKINNNEKDV